MNLWKSIVKHRYQSPIVHYCDRSLDVRAIIRSYNIPRPSVQYCLQCGTKLRAIIFGARRHYFGAYDEATGKAWFIIDAKYVCPQNTKHYVEANGHAVYWSNWSSNKYYRWHWNTLGTLTEMKRDTGLTDSVLGLQIKEK